MTDDLQIVPLRKSEMINHEAADWLSKLDGDNLNNSDRRALKAWLLQSPEHVHALKSLANIWSDMGLLLNGSLVDGNGIREGRLDSHLQEVKMNWRFLSTTMACAICMLVFGWMFITPEVVIEDDSGLTMYITDVGMQRVETLSDGSTASLNTDSMIEIEYSNDHRIVRLLRGEAMFDVTHDPARPFIVYAGNQAVKAIGTRFVVRLKSESIQVTVADGRVELSKRILEPGSIASAEQNSNRVAQKVIIVDKGQEVEVGANVLQPQAREVETDEMERKLSWLEGGLVFKDERLEQVVEDVSRYMSVPIVIANPELRDVLISGRFEIGDTEALLGAMEVSLDIHISRLPDKSKIYLSR